MATGEAKNPKQRTEAHPNPHGEQDIAAMPLRKDHSAATRRSVGGTPNTTENRMNPSVTGPLEDPTDDSMFNNADPQTRELLQSKSKRQTKTGKHSKVA